MNKLLTLCILSLLAPSLSQAQNKKFSLEKLEKNYHDASSLEADFVQEIYQAALARTKTSSGNLRLQKPGNVRWETYKPEANVMVTNGRKLWYYTPNAGSNGKGQVLVRNANELQSQVLFRILTGSSALSKEFQVLNSEKLASKGNPGFSTRISLKPKKKINDLSEVELLVSDKYLISEIFLRNSSGNTTKISLLNQQLNAKLPSVLFDFIPPPGVEIMKSSD